MNLFAATASFPENSARLSVADRLSCLPGQGFDASDRSVTVQ